ncbi:non-ribosomal peptide synthetase [Saccharothrix algeriensis]|uniref:Amino acid adenylation domain-containing protein n=1 Tax=Saccharothrix algeriensis TaxID=173560 RepID=A0A8T8HZ45_9PSEU|nr:non-ribosomal peptide synthetase [Saccharothrix algeriensis]MBM7809361.1 amino acid adenylation domain-containing protein [Saccharothrix algeriensis]QTR03708.1 amino acid adenylation domain-containing protein [Saccharothrix algeriensis]
MSTVIPDGREVFRFPASSGQRRLWLLDQLVPGPVYNIGWRVALDGPLDPGALRAALDAVVARHEALRTRFEAEDGVPVQVVSSAQPVELPVLDVAADGLDDAVRELVRRPFDLHAGPLLRAALLRLPDRHVLVLVLHHSIADGWSCSVLFDELAHCYAGDPADLPELPVQYPDYAVWQREQVEGDAFAADAAHWREALRGAPTVLPLPGDRPRPARPTGRGAELRRELRVGDGSFPALLALFQCVLHRVTGQADFLVATPVAARTRPETEGLVGFVANTLPLRARFAAGTTLGEVVRAAEAATVAALAHQDLPFEQLVDLVAPQRTLAHAPLVQVMFAVEPLPRARRAGAVTMRPEPVANGGAKFDLSLTVEHDGDRWFARWQYDAELFEEATIAALHTAFATAAAHADPAVEVAELPLTSAAPAPVAGPHRGGTALDLVSAALAAHPDALVGTLTCGEIDRAANRLAHALVAAGARPDRPVALCLERGTPTVVGVLAAWRAGAGYLPLDPSWPVDRLTAMATDSGVPVLVTDAASRARTRLGGPWADVDLDTATGPDTPPDVVAPIPGSLAYVIHTSGSTGRPKGVHVTQGGLAALIAAMDDLLDLSPDDVLVSFTTPAFDVSTVELLVPLLRGTRVVTVPADDVADGALLRRHIAEAGATVVQGGPASWRMIVAAGGVPAHVRLRVTGGEALTRDLADQLQSDGATLVDGYGPTETTVYSAVGVVPRGPEPIRLGPAVPGTTLHVLDPLLRPVLPGLIGELHVGGAGVARGYHGLPALTADRFLPDPFGGGRLYATGDLVRLRADGRLEFLGRADRQVKVRGFRIEPGEVEAVLRAHPDVADAVVTTWSANEVDVRLVAHVVLRRGDTEALRPHLAAKLPEYMVPAAIVALDALPRTGSGKTDRDALPEPEWTAGDAAHVPPRDDAETRMASIWRDVLSIPADRPLGVHDNFFALGGHSLTATQMLARVRAAMGADLALATLFAAPTIAALCAALTTADGGARGPVPLLDQLDDLSDAEIDRLLGTLADDDR